MLIHFLCFCSLQGESRVLSERSKGRENSVVKSFSTMWIRKQHFSHKKTKTKLQLILKLVLNLSRLYNQDGQDSFQTNLPTRRALIGNNKRPRIAKAIKE